MSGLIEIMVAGLIAFVPSADPAKSLTAYLVHADDHVGSFTVFGKNAVLDPEGQALPCKAQDGIIDCELRDVRTILISEMKSGKLVLPLKGVSAKRHPDPGKENDDKSLAWFVRMSNIDDKKGHPVQNIGNYIDTQMAFNPVSAVSSELDGSEAGIWQEIGFHTQGVPDSKLVQTVAESLTFVVKIKSPAVTITLVDKDGNPIQKITSKCPSSGSLSCLGLKMDNKFSGQPGCEDGEHFLHFYPLVDDQNPGMLPFSIHQRPCNKSVETKIVDFNFLRDVLRIIRPAAPREVKSVIKKFLRADRVATTQEVLEKSLRAFPRLAKRQDLVDRIIEHRKVQDRIICPPVLLEAN